MLPNLKTERDWLSEDHSSGVQVCIKEQMEPVMAQLQEMISEQLVGANVRAIALAQTLLAKSMRFATDLCTYVSLTLTELKAAGF